ncbi:MAG: hypothetical protein AAB448_03380 [Patescibacteria group bacterium]
MKFSSLYRSFYDASPEENGENRELKEFIAQKTFKKTKHIPMNIFTKTAFAAFAFLVAGSLFAPQAFAETVKFVDSTITVATDKIQVLVTRAFDKDRDIFSDEDITNITEDSSINSVEYTRDEEGEKLKLTKECDPDETCDFSLMEGIEVNVDGVDAIDVEGSSDEDGAMMLITPSETNTDNKDEEGTDTQWFTESSEE